MKRWRTTLILLGIFALLLAYVLIFERKREPPPSPGATPSPTPSPLVAVEREEIRALHITWGNAEVRIEPSPPSGGTEGGQSGWQITVPQAGPADTYNISWPIDELAGLSARRTILESVDDPSQYGLGSEALILDIETAERTVRLLVGRETPDGTAFYVQVEGDPRLYIVDHYKIAPLFEWVAEPPYQPTPTPAAES
jgi:hypothetical protein